MFTCRFTRFLGNHYKDKFIFSIFVLTIGFAMLQFYNRYKMMNLDSGKNAELHDIFELKKFNKMREIYLFGY